MSDFDDFLSIDPLQSAENLTGQSYKDDEETSNLGLYLALAHNAEKEFELSMRDDSHYNVLFEDYRRIVGELGFELVFEEEFGEGEAYCLYWRRGLLLACESYGDGLNSATVYFNADFVDGNPWTLSISGHLNAEAYDGEKRKIWVGQLDGREAIRHAIARLESEARILEDWVETPFLHLLNYLEGRSGCEYKLATSMKVAELPRAVQESMGVS